MKAVGLPEGRKEEMVTTLIERYAPKRSRKRKADVLHVDAVAAEEEGEGEGEGGEEADE